MNNKIKFVFTFVSILTFLLVLSCSIDKPKAPNFETEFSIPISSKIYLMSELADDEENLFIDENNDFGFLIEGEFDTVKANEVLKYDESLRSNGAFEIDAFKINATDTLTDSSLTIVKFWEQAAQSVGEVIPIQPFDFAITSDKAIIYEFEEFTSVTIDTGYVVMMIENHLGVPLGTPLTITLRDLNANNQVVGTFDFNEGIPNGANRVMRIDLAGKQVSNRVVVELSGSSPGSGEQSVEIDLEEQRAIINIAVSRLQATNAIARIPELNLDRSDWLNLNDETDEISMIEAEFDKCLLNIFVKSYLELNSNFNLIIENIFDSDGKTLQIPIYLEKNGSVDLNRSLDGWFLKSDVSISELEPRIKIRAEGTTESTGKNMAVVSSRDSISVSTTMADVKLKFVRGAINRLEVEMDTTEQDLDFDFDMPQIKFRQTEVSLNVYNNIAFPLELNLTFRGQKNTGEQERYEFRQKSVEPAVVPAGQQSSQQVLTRFSIDDENFDRLINMSPDKITIEGSAFIGKHGYISQIHENDFVYGKFTLRAPFEISFEDTVLNVDTTFIQISPPDWNTPKAENIDYELESELTEDILSGDVWAVFENKLPIAATAIVRIDTSLERLYQKTGCLVVRSAGLRAGVKNMDGLIEKAQVDTLDFHLTNEEMQLFKNDSDLPKMVYIGIQMDLEGSQGEYIKIYPDDYIAIRKSYFRFRYLIKNED